MQHFKKTIIQKTQEGMLLLRLPCTKKIGLLANKVLFAVTCKFKLNNEQGKPLHMKKNKKHSQIESVCIILWTTVACVPHPFQFFSFYCSHLGFHHREGVLQYAYPLGYSPGSIHLLYCGSWLIPPLWGIAGLSWTDSCKKTLKGQWEQEEKKTLSFQKGLRLIWFQSAVGGSLKLTRRRETFPKGTEPPSQTEIFAWSSPRGKHAASPCNSCLGEAYPIVSETQSHSDKT